MNTKRGRERKSHVKLQRTNNDDDNVDCHCDVDENKMLQNEKTGFRILYIHTKYGAYVCWASSHIAMWCYWAHAELQRTFVCKTITAKQVVNTQRYTLIAWTMVPNTGFVTMQANDI